MRSTSVEAFNDIRSRGLLSESRLAVYTWLYLHGPATGTQVDQHVSSHAHKRLPELRDQGVIAEVGEVECPVTKRNVILWDVTPELPNETLLPRAHARPTRKQLIQMIRHLRAENTKLAAALDAYGAKPSRLEH